MSVHDHHNDPRDPINTIENGTTPANAANRAAFAAERSDRGGPALAVMIAVAALIVGGLAWYAFRDDPHITAMPASTPAAPATTGSGESSGRL